MSRAVEEWRIELLNEGINAMLTVLKTELGINDEEAKALAAEALALSKQKNR